MKESSEEIFRQEYREWQGRYRRALFDLAVSRMALWGYHKAARDLGLADPEALASRSHALKGRDS